jgi:hypothetical protein
VVQPRIIELSVNDHHSGMCFCSFSDQDFGTEGVHQKSWYLVENNLNQQEETKYKIVMSS